jgi:hypothetical protein
VAIDVCGQCRETSPSDQRPSGAVQPAKQYVLSPCDWDFGQSILQMGLYRVIRTKF